MESALSISKAGRRYGLFHDNPYHPAKKLLLLRLPAVVLAPQGRTSQWCGPVRDQGPEGSCTGQLKAEYRDWMYRKLYAFEKDKSVPPDQFVASAAFAYQTNLIADGDLGGDCGSSIHQTFVTLDEFGCCLQGEEPYTGTDYTARPTPQQYTEALVYKGGPYHCVSDLNDVKSCIASGYACGFGIDVYDSFEGEDLAKTGFMPMPGPNENLLGGHAQLGVDYDDTVLFPDGSIGGVLVQNSWGSKWGLSAPGRSDRGFYWMPYGYFAAGHVSDIWMMHLGPAWKPVA